MTVKQLSKSKKSEIEDQNKARELAELEPIKIKVRKCIACEEMFESAGDRTCGCNSGQSFIFPKMAM